MGTILNTCKDARKNIKEIEDKMNEAVIAWKINEDNSKEIAVYLEDKAKEIRLEVSSLMGKLEVIGIELEKDSEVRPYYAEVYSTCRNFLIVIEKK